MATHLIVAPHGKRINTVGQGFWQAGSLEAAGIMASRCQVLKISMKVKVGQERNIAPRFPGRLLVASPWGCTH